MKKILLTAFTCCSALFAFAQTTHNVGVLAGPFRYSPAAWTIQAGDKVTFTAGSLHPLLEVDEATWNANGDVAKSGGFSCSSTCTLDFPNVGTYYYVCPNHVSNSTPMKGKIVVEAPTGIQNESFSSNGLKLFPNPAKGTFSIQFAQATSVESVQILGSSGMVVMQQTVGKTLSQHQVDVSGLQAGLYQVVINTGSQKLLQKLVVE
jgi:plastocyanin